MAFFQFFGVGSVLEVLFEGVLADVVWSAGSNGGLVDS